MNPFQFRIALRFDHAMHSGHTDISGAAMGTRIEQRLHGGVHIDGGNAHPQDIGSFHGFSGIPPLPWLGRRSEARIPMSAAPLPQRLDDKAGIADNVAAPQSPGLQAEPEQPLQSAAHHPSWCLPDVPCMEVECRAHGKKCSRIQTGPEFRHPIILLRCTQPAPDDIGFSRIDPLGNFIFFLIGQGPERGRVQTRDFQPGEFL